MTTTKQSPKRSQKRPWYSHGYLLEGLQRPFCNQKSINIYMENQLRPKIVFYIFQRRYCYVIIALYSTGLNDFYVPGKYDFRTQIASKVDTKWRSKHIKQLIWKSYLKEHAPWSKWRPSCYRWVQDEGKRALSAIGVALLPFGSEQGKDNTHPVPGIRGTWTF